MRRKRNMTVTEKIAYTEELIEKKSAELDELKSQLSELETQKKQEEMEELYNAIAESGMTISEVKELLVK